MSVREHLLDLLQQARDEESRFASCLNEAVREQHGTSQAWAPKDVLAHIAVWKHVTAQYLVAGLDGREYEVHQNLDKENEQIFQHYLRYSWASVLEIMDLSYKELLGRVRDMPEADLIDADRFPWLDGRSFWERILDNTVYHPIWHIAHLYTQQGDVEHGRRLITSFTQKLLGADDSAHGQGHYLYNLACYHVLTGRTDEAIDPLQRAFQLRPELIEWSKQDQDLASLWQDPAYLALVS